MDEIKIRETLKKYDQEHLLKFYDKLDDASKKRLLAQIASIDFEKIKSANECGVEGTIQCEIEPIKSVKKAALSSNEAKRLGEIGKQIIQSGKYAVVTMAGGQGTRLGHNGPKGTFKLQLKDKERYIFEILIDTLKRAHAKYDVYIPWYIMTSEANNDETIAFFEENNYFGYPKEKVNFFKQGELPITDFDGKILLEEKDKVLMAADGNGGIFNAMGKMGVIDEMKALRNRMGYNYRSRQYNSKSCR